jgi:hypothetical protein
MRYLGPRVASGFIIFWLLVCQCWNFITIMGGRNREGIRLPYRPAEATYRLSKTIPWNRFLGSLKVVKYRP